MHKGGALLFYVLYFCQYSLTFFFMKCLSLDSRQYFLCGMRLFFGSWLLYSGLSKWISVGAVAFVGYITSQFDATWSPHLLNVVLGWLIVIAEPVLGAWLLSGKRMREAWSLTSLLMFMFVLGQTLLMKPDMMLGLWFYTALTLACAALSSPVADKK